MYDTYAKMTVVGRLTDQPTLHDTGNTKVGHMTLAVDRPGKEKETDFFRVTTWGRNAEQCHEKLRKGQLVLAEGRPEIQEWEKNGQKHRTLDLQAQEIRNMEPNRSRDTQAAASNDSPDR